MPWTERLISFAVLLQTLELFAIKPWDWSIQREECARALQPLLRPYRLWLVLRFASAALTLIAPNPWTLLAQLLTTWLINVRWRGTFNGGSDCMTVQILLASTVAAFFPGLQLAAVFYISLQVMLSYFVAGVAKLRERAWRRGEALPRFLGLAKASMPFLSWAVILFECLFPLAFLDPRALIFFLGVGVAFHLANFYCFGLNRFFWAWTATYPALITAARVLRA